MGRRLFVCTYPGCSTRPAKRSNCERHVWLMHVRKSADKLRYVVDFDRAAVTPYIERWDGPRTVREFREIDVAQRPAMADNPSSSRRASSAMEGAMERLGVPSGASGVSSTAPTPLAQTPMAGTPNSVTPSLATPNPMTPPLMAQSSPSPDPHYHHHRHGAADMHVYARPHADARARAVGRSPSVMAGHDSGVPSGASSASNTPYPHKHHPYAHGGAEYGAGAHHAQASRHHHERYAPAPASHATAAPVPAAWARDAHHQDTGFGNSGGAYYDSPAEQYGADGHRYERDADDFNNTNDRAAYCGERSRSRTAHVHRHARDSYASASQPYPNPTDHMFDVRRASTATSGWASHNTTRSNTPGSDSEELRSDMARVAHNNSSMYVTGPHAGNSSTPHDHDHHHTFTRNRSEREMAESDVMRAVSHHMGRRYSAPIPAVPAVTSPVGASLWRPWDDKCAA